MEVLITGASGMIGSTLARVISSDERYEVIAVGRRSISKLSSFGNARYFQHDDLSIESNISELFDRFRPQVVINCAGLTKHYPEGNEPIAAIQLNALMPHLLAKHCESNNAYLIQISSDCVFDGSKGNYIESDNPNASDVYGKSKALGEVFSSPHLTLRTSTIGHENKTSVGLLEWFLKQEKCEGFSKAVFSGLPTVEFANVVKDYVLPDSSLSGLYQVGADPINKFKLLTLIADVYGLDVDVDENQIFTVDRSLNSDKFKSVTGYQAPDWESLISLMHKDHLGSV